MQALPRSARLRIPKAGYYWLFAVAGLATVGLYKNINLILLLAYFLGGMFALNWWHVRRSRIGVSIEGPGPLGGFAGEWLACTATLRSTSPRPLRGLTVRLLAADGELRWYIPRLAAGGTADLVRSFRPQRRGRYDTRQWEMVHGHPFGLIESVVTVVETAPTVVYPHRGRLRLGQLLRQLRNAPAPRGQRRTTVRHVAEGTDVLSLRQYRVGDSPRWIHWRTSARRGELMVREFDRSAGPGAAIVVDVSSGDALGWEAALSFTATVVGEWTAAQDSRLTIALPGLGGWVVESVAGRRQAAALLDRLADAAPASGAGGLPRLPARVPRILVGRQHPSNAIVAGSPDLWLNPTVPSEWYRPPVPSHD